MEVGETRSDGGATGHTLFGTLFLAAGLGLAGYGAYLHLTIAARLQAGRCDGCSPWHPLFVVAPLVVGAVLVVVAGYLLSRR